MEGVLEDVLKEARKKSCIDELLRLYEPAEDLITHLYGLWRRNSRNPGSPPSRMRPREPEPSDVGKGGDHRKSP